MKCPVADLLRLFCLHATREESEWVAETFFSCSAADCLLLFGLELLVHASYMQILRVNMLPKLSEFFWHTISISISEYVARSE